VKMSVTLIRALCEARKGVVAVHVTALQIPVKE
jgi:hypothetical protein